MTEILRIIFYCFMEKYATFEGRAGRKEFAAFTLFFFLISYTFIFVYNPKGFSLINWLLMLLFISMIIPGMAVSIRRLHDLNCSGWWYVLWCTALLLLPRGMVVPVNLIFFFLKGTPGSNSYGDVPNKIDYFIDKPGKKTLKTIISEIPYMIFYGFTKKYASFKGRAGRKEFTTLTLVFFSICSIILAYESDQSLLFFVSFLKLLFVILIIPSMAVFVRRLHDLNCSGWWSVLYYSLVSFMVLLYSGWWGFSSALWMLPIIFTSLAYFLTNIAFCLLKGTPGTNKYGEPPN